MKPSVEKAIAARRQRLRGGRSVRQVSADQHDIDSRNREWRKIRNRTTWARNPANSPKHLDVRRTEQAA